MQYVSEDCAGMLDRIPVLERIAAHSKNVRAIVKAGNPTYHEPNLLPHHRQQQTRPSPGSTSASVRAHFLAMCPGFGRVIDSVSRR